MGSLNVLCLSWSTRHCLVPACLPSTQCASRYSQTRETSSPIDTQVVAVDVVVVLAVIVRPSASQDSY